MRSIEFEEVGVSFPSARIPSMKEWIVRKFTGRGNIEWFPALTDVSFTVDAGECLGIVGANGAGKSTLLRVAAGVLVPSAGRAIITGSVAPLIELGTGFDGELSGRENIFFNGALLGRSRAHMEGRFDEIVEFSGLSDFLDLPLRTYSTGMVARLAFSIATAVDADVVLLDEILSVGDAAFQRRCEERILGFRERGATILLVSHDLGSIEKLCDRAMWVHEGRLRANGTPSEIVREYRDAGVAHELRHDRSAPPTDITTAAREWSSKVVTRDKVVAVFQRTDSDEFARRFSREITERVVVAGGAGRVIEAAPGDRVAECIERAAAEYALFVPDRPFMPSPNLVAALVETLDAMSDVDVAVPLTNDMDAAIQGVEVPAYLTLRQFEAAAEMVASAAQDPVVVDWASSEQAICLLRGRAFISDTGPLSGMLVGKRVAVVRSAFVHQFVDFSHVLRSDLLALLPLDARKVLEVGCGSGLLGRELKERQSCRVVGISRAAASAGDARRHIDRLLVGDFLSTLGTLEERFDAIVLHESFEGVADPWTLLKRLRALAEPRARLIISAHNAASWPVVSDLLRGRFDYVFAGHLSAGNLRFFTERSLRELIEMSGWNVVSISAQPQIETEELHRLRKALLEGDVQFSDAALAAHAFLVVAENPGDAVPADGSGL